MLINELSDDERTRLHQLIERRDKLNAESKIVSTEIKRLILGQRPGWVGDDIHLSERRSPISWSEAKKHLPENLIDRVERLAQRTEYLVATIRKGR